MAVLRQVWVIQCTRSGNFLSESCEFVQSLAQAGRVFNAEEAHETGRCQLGYEFEVHTFWEADEA